MSFSKCHIAFSAAAMILAGAAPRAFALSLTINSGGSVNLGNRVYTSITITNGTAVNNTGTPVTSSVTFGGSMDNWTGKLDLQSNKMIVQAVTGKAAAFAALQNQVAYGVTHAGGIVSTTLPAQMGIAVIDNAVTNFTSFGGPSVDGNSLLLAPELLGDATVDGQVDSADLSIVLSHFGQATGDWTSGNFDHGGTIDLTDLADVLNNFGTSNPSPFAAAVSLPQGSSAVPEPASALLLGFPVLGLQLRRRRKV